MNNPIYIENGILEQIKNFGYICQYTITKESGDCNNNIEYSNYDTTDQVDIESIEEI